MIQIRNNLTTVIEMYDETIVLKLYVHGSESKTRY